MIERINLIEKEAFQFSYTRLMQAVMGVVAFCALLYGAQIGRGIYYEKKIQELRSEQSTLQSQQKALAKAKPTQITEGSNSELQKIFLDTPRWSDLLKDLSGRLPPTIWFTGVKASTSRTGMPKSGDSKANAPKGAPADAPGGKNSIVLTGVASSVGDLAVFVASLQQSPFVSKATLTNSKEEEARFTFEIVCDMMVPRI